MKIEQEFKDLRPVTKQNIMELVSQAGIDTSDWGNFAGKYAASNPKYCYNWSFEDLVENVIAVNLWYDRIKLDDGAILCEFNPRLINSDNVRKQRVEHLDRSIAKAFKRRIPLRVILLGKEEGSKRPDYRALDSKYWYVHSYDDNGNCKIVRDKSQQEFVDQFTLIDTDIEPPSKAESTASAYRRSRVVREQVLLRAQGYCEYCNAKGFITKVGSVYLESHHIIPLSEGGDDDLKNVIALCPNHHREAHYSAEALQLRNAFFQKIERKSSWVESELSK